MSDTKQKNRHLSPFEYFEAIQTEYLCSILRTRIYTRNSDREYWNRVANGKRQLIESIASRNRLPSIFTDSDLEAAISRKIYRENTYPIFCYRDQEHRKSQEYYDLLYYYDKGCNVRFDYMGEVMVGTVAKYTPFSETIKIKVKSIDHPITVNVDEVSRII